MNLKSFLLVLFSYILITSCYGQKTTRKDSQRKSNPQVIPPPILPSIIKKPEITPQILPKLPSIPREFRAVWIASVANINWPSKNNLSTHEQKAEAIEILDQLKSANFNAVIFQVRPSSDALYRSNLEPWSYFLTGTVGKAPEPYYDPLEFWIEESHKRGMQLHAWINPYRAHHSNGGKVTEKSIAHKMKEQTIRLKNGMYWLDPSDQLVQDHTAAVIQDIVKRYNIDAIHIDDYFYPYREYNGGKDFPDHKSWNAYLKSGGTLSRADWRRKNVNDFIKRIHSEIKSIKPTVQFGISPFGIWKSGFPSDIKGSSQYDDLFADAKLWLNEGWCDYFSPQLYWKDGGAQSYTSLLNWWQTENTKKIHLWPGINTVGIKGVSNKQSEISNQISITRNALKNDAGVIHYSMAGISKNPLMFSELKKIYSEKALVPKSAWLPYQKLNKPQIEIKKQAQNYLSTWSTNPNVRNWILYTLYDSEWSIEILDNTTNSFTIPITKNNKKLKSIALQSADRLGNESEAAFHIINEK